MFPLIFNSVCAQKFVREKTLVFFCKVKLILFTLISLKKRSLVLKSCARRSFLCG